MEDLIQVEENIQPFPPCAGSVPPDADVQYNAEPLANLLPPYTDIEIDTELHAESPSPEADNHVGLDAEFPYSQIKSVKMSQ